MILPSRRRFLLGAGALIAAPSIVRASSLMPVSVLYGGPVKGSMPAWQESNRERWLRIFAEVNALAPV
jgi:hypothetical protein